MNGMRILIVVPAYNEENNIENVITDLVRNVSGADILIVNDCSKDRTEQTARAISKHYDNVKVLSLIFNLGYAGALQTGFKYAVRNNYDYIMQFDGDGQHIASEVPKLLREGLASKADIVLGSRYFPGSIFKQTFLRRIGTWIFRKIIHVTTGLMINDPTSGFQLLSRRVFSYYAEKGVYPQYPDANILIDAVRRGYVIREVPAVMRERIFGTSMHASLLSNVKYMIQVLFSIIIALMKSKTGPATRA